MISLKKELAAMLPARTLDNAKEGPNDELYVPVTGDEFYRCATAVSAKGYVLISLFCVQDFETSKGLSLFYAFESRKHSSILVLQRKLDDGGVRSIAGLFPSACWFEREAADGFGIRFEDSFDTRRLFLHEPYPKDFHPMLKQFANRDISKETSARLHAVKDEYVFKKVEGEGVYQIPVGPVHAGIIEPGHFRFSVIGETVFNLEIRMFYKHRGIEKLAQGKDPCECVKVAQAISGDETAANSYAFCDAVEKISGAAIPPRAMYLRMILLELERIYSHLGDMAGMIVDVAYSVGASAFFMLREDILRMNESLTGSRFQKDAFCIGGLDKEISKDKVKSLIGFFERFQRRFKDAVSSALAVPSVVDRFESTGIIRKDLIDALNISGPPARASGASIDTRIDHPYGMYDELFLSTKTLEAGDVLARFNVKSAEVLDSIRMIKKLASAIPGGAVLASVRPKDGYAISLVESARGQNFHFVYIKDGKVQRYKVRTASFCNWQAIEHAVPGNIVPDFPLINKSLNLSYAGTDL